MIRRFPRLKKIYRFPRISNKKKILSMEIIEELAAEVDPESVLIEEDLKEIYHTESATVDSRNFHTLGAKVFEDQIQNLKKISAAYSLKTKIWELFLRVRNHS